MMTNADVGLRFDALADHLGLPRVARGNWPGPQGDVGCDVDWPEIPSELPPRAPPAPYLVW